jgi:hypothetical protein
MAHAQPRVTALFNVHWRPAESKNEKVSKALFRPAQILHRINLRQSLIVRNLR